MPDPANSPAPLANFGPLCLRPGDGATALVAVMGVREKLNPPPGGSGTGSDLGGGLKGLGARRGSTAGASVSTLSAMVDGFAAGAATGSGAGAGTASTGGGSGTGASSRGSVPGAASFFVLPHTKHFILRPFPRSCPLGHATRPTNDSRLGQTKPNVQSEAAMDASDRSSLEGEDSRTRPRSLRPWPHARHHPWMCSAFQTFAAAGDRTGQGGARHPRGSLRPRRQPRGVGSCREGAPPGVSCPRSSGGGARYTRRARGWRVPDVTGPAEGYRGRARRRPTPHAGGRGLHGAC